MPVDHTGCHEYTLYKYIPGLVRACCTLYNHLLPQDLLEQRKIDPPYNPEVHDNMDLKHFSKEFTQQTVPGTTVVPPNTAVLRTGKK